MPGTTVNYAFPYPLDNDFQLSTDVSDGIVAIDTKIKQHKDALDTLTTTVNTTGKVGDSGWITAGFVAATGWSILMCRARKINNITFVETKLQRTGAALVGNASGTHAGNIVGDPAIVTVPTGYRPFGAQNLMGAAGTTYGTATVGISSGGSVFVSATNTGASISTNDYITANFQFPGSA